MRELTKTEITVVKNTAKSIQPFVVKREKLIAEQAKLQAEIEANEMQINAFEQAIKSMTGGYTTKELITVQKKKVGEKDGKDVFTNEYIFHYPVEEDNTSLEDLLN
jgi:hypothetical protein